MKNKIILIGCGGHSKVCADVILNDNKYQLAGFVCNKKKILNYKLLVLTKNLKK